MALSSAAVLTVYAAGYLRTRAAAEKLQAADRARIVIPGPPSAVTMPVAALEPAATPATTPADPAPVSSPKPAPSRIADTKPADVAKPDHAKPVAPVTPAPETPARATAEPPASEPAAVSIASTPVVTPTPSPTPTPTPTPTPEPPAPLYKDGTFSGWGTSRHGDIEATVVIADGRITSARISQCWTRYSCSWVAHLQGQVVTRQSPEVDYVTGATQSANAFYYAVVQALSKAK